MRTTAGGFSRTATETSLRHSSQCHLLAAVDVEHDLGGHIPDAFVIDVVEDLLLPPAERTRALILGHQHEIDVALDVSSDLHRLNTLALLPGLRRRRTRRRGRIGVSLRRGPVHLLRLRWRRDRWLAIRREGRFVAIERKHQLPELLERELFGAAAEAIPVGSYDAPRELLIVALELSHRPDDLVHRLGTAALREHLRDVRLQRFQTQLAL